MSDSCVPQTALDVRAAIRVANLFLAGRDHQRAVFDLLRTILPGAGTAKGALAAPPGFVNDGDPVTVFVRWVMDKRPARTDNIPFTRWAAAVRQAAGHQTAPVELDEWDARAWAHLVDVTVLDGDQLLQHLDASTAVVADFRSDPHVGLSRVEPGFDGPQVVLSLTGKSHDGVTILRDLPVGVTCWVAAVEAIS